VKNPSQFADQSFNKRLNNMGDLAEGVFEEWCGTNFARYGLNRPPIAMWKLPAKIRYTPDYITSDYLVEVQGFGRKQVVHMKLDKWDALLWWVVEPHHDARTPVPPRLAQESGTDVPDHRVDALGGGR